ERLGADGAEVFFFIETQRGPLFFFGVAHGQHVIIKAGDGDAAILVEESAENLGQNGRGVGEDTAVHAAVEVARRAVELDVEVDQAAKAVGDRGGLAVPHIRVADEDEVVLRCGERVPVFFEIRVQARAAALLFALDQHGDVNRKLSGGDVV